MKNRIKYWLIFTLLFCVSFILNLGNTQALESGTCTYTFSNSTGNRELVFDVIVNDSKDDYGLVIIQDGSAFGKPINIDMQHWDTKKYTDQCPKYIYVTATVYTAHYSGDIICNADCTKMTFKSFKASGTEIIDDGRTIQEMIDELEKKLKEKPSSTTCHYKNSNDNIKLTVPSEWYTSTGSKEGICPQQAYKICSAQNNLLCSYSFESAEPAMCSESVLGIKSYKCTKYTNYVPTTGSGTGSGTGQSGTGESGTGNNDDYTVPTVSCGHINDIPKALPKLTSIFIDLIKVIVPIGIVVKGMIDLAKAAIAQKEDEIKKGTQMFVKRLIAGVIVFFVVVITQTVVNMVGNDLETSTLPKCINCFINNECD